MESVYVVNVINSIWVLHLFVYFVYGVLSNCGALFSIGNACVFHLGPLPIRSQSVMV